MDAHPRKIPEFDLPLTSENLKKIFADCADFDAREVFIGGNPRNRAHFFCFDGLTSGGDISELVLRPLSDTSRFGKAESEKKLIKAILSGGVYHYSMRCRDCVDDVAQDLLNGWCAIVFDGEEKAVTFETKTGEKRSVDEPKVEKVVKGSRDAFVETLRTNTSLVRRKIRTPKLKMRESIVGRQTRTKINVVYIEGLTNPDFAKEALRRLDAIDVEGMLSPADIEEYLEEGGKTPFPKLLYTERADKFCINILEGRVGVLVDGMPTAFLLPATFAQFVKAPEDNAVNFLTASALTLLRYISMLITLMLPAIYVAVAIYHQEMLPTKLLLSIIESKRNVPFSTAAEVLSMLVAFELLQEAGLRLPEPIGATVSIIGALIVGQSAVEASVISPVVVIVVATAGVTGYTMPNQDMSAALRLCRFLLVLAALAAGMFGVAVGSVLLVYHLSGLESFGVAYMTPFAGKNGEILRALVRKPLKSEKYRERALKTPNRRKER